MCGKYSEGFNRGILDYICMYITSAKDRFLENAY